MANLSIDNLPESYLEPLQGETSALLNEAVNRALEARGGLRPSVGSIAGGRPICPPVKPICPPILVGLIAPSPHKDILA